MPSSDAASEVEPLVYKVSAPPASRADETWQVRFVFWWRLVVVAILFSISVGAPIAAVVLADQAKTAAEGAERACQRSSDGAAEASSEATRAKTYASESFSQAFIHLKALRKQVELLQHSAQATHGSEALSMLPTGSPAAPVPTLPAALQQLPATLQNISALLERVGQATSKTDQALHGGKLRLVLD